MSATTWYWLILIIWIIFGVVGDWFLDDPRLRKGGNLALIVLLVLIGFIIAGSPIK